MTGQAWQSWDFEAVLSAPPLLSLEDGIHDVSLGHVLGIILWSLAGTSQTDGPSHCWSTVVRMVIRQSEKSQWKCFRKGTRRARARASLSPLVPLESL